MKKLTPVVAAMICAGMLAFASCDKDEKDDNNNTNPGTTKTQKDYLLDGKWLLTSESTIVKLNGEVIEADTVLDDCEKDNTNIFLTSGKLLEDEGSLKCDSADPQTDSTNTWELSADYKTLTVTTDDNEFAGKMGFSVTELSSSDLKIDWSKDSSFMGQNVNFRIKLTFKNTK